MKISIFLMFIGIGMISASSSYSQNTVLSLKVSNKTLKDVFREIENKSEYIFFYNDEAVNVNKRVDISVTGATITQILDKVLDKTSGYRIEDRQVIIYKTNEPIIEAVTENKEVEQNRATVNGKVTDSEGEPLPGVSVTEKGTTNAVMTDIDGNYSISLRNPNATLIFTYVGYETAEQAIGSRNVVNVVLQTKSSDLDEVIVVGYGTQRKSSITGSIASVNVGKMKDITTPSVANMLQGKVAGVVVTPTSGQPGAGVSIRVRGTGSIGASKEPLWVIDGVVGGTSADLNPNDIEAISILKDGSATALYGSRGANGVVLVTTKRGTRGISNVDVSAKMGISQLTKGNLKIMNGAEHYEYAKVAYENADATPSWFQPYLAQQNFDWWDLATQNGVMQNYNVAYTYGGDNVRSYIGGDYYTEEGTIKGYNYDRFTLRVNNDWVVNKRLTLKAKLSASYKENKSQEYSLNYTTVLPWDSPWDSNGNVKYVTTQSFPSASEAGNADPRDYWYSRMTNNYLYDRHLKWGKSRTNAIDVGAGFDYKILDYLTFESNNRFGFSNYYYDGYTDPNAAGQSPPQGLTRGRVDYNTNYQRKIYTSQMLRFLKVFGEKHEINAFAGYDYDEFFYQTSEAYRNNIFPGGEVIDSGTGIYIDNDGNEQTGRGAAGNKETAKNAAYFFNGNYSYDGKYLFQASVRRDGSSHFGANKRWATFWSVGGGWNMHEEDFIKTLGFIDQLKPRVSYGITGNLPGGRYEWITRYSIQEYSGNIAFYSNYAGNPDLMWEQTKSLNLGFDARLFDRLNITFDYYNKNVKNMIYLRQLSAVSGFNRQRANDGKMNNKGFEVTITPEIIKTKDLYWDVSFNIGYNKNMINYYPERNLDGNHIEDTNVPYRSWYLKEWAGVDPQTGLGMWYKVDENGQKTATSTFEQATQVVMKSSLPKYTGGINTNFSWKDLTLSASFTFSQGAWLYNEDRRSYLDKDGLDPTMPAMKLASGWSRWEKPGDIATHPRLYYGSTGNNADNPSSRWLERGDYFKMKTLSLTYNLPKKWLAPTGLKALSVTVSGENLFTITDFSGYDPEIYLSDDNGVASGGYPTTRRFTVGLNLKF